MVNIFLTRMALVSCLLLALPMLTHGQELPAERHFADAWRRAGTSPDVPYPDRVVSVEDFGAHTDGETNTIEAIQAALAALEGQPGIVYFPAGTYRLSSTLNLPEGVVLRGESPETTTLLFDNVNHCLAVSQRQTETFQPILGDARLHDAVVTVTNGRHFAVGDDVEIRIQNDPSWRTSRWAQHSVGQITRVTGVDGNRLQLAHRLRLDYPQRLNPEIRKVQMIRHVGIENLLIRRLLVGTGQQRNNMFTIQFRYAADSWVRGCELVNGFGGHVGIEFSSHIDVTGCYIHHAHDYDGGGSGYGVRLEYRTGDCLIENNIFHTLRHAMLVQAGVNGNVFGYNYSFNAYSDSHGAEAGDLSLHGNYPYANLFEGNIVEHIWMDNSHGVNGPLNLFFRNRAARNGFNMTQPESHRQNIIGNELFRGGIRSRLMAGDGYRLQGHDHFAFGNQHVDKGVQPPGTTHLTDVSYYLGTDPKQSPPLPDWWTVDEALPVIGFPHALGEAKAIPAYARYHGSGPNTVGPTGSLTPTVRAASP